MIELIQIFFQLVLFLFLSYFPLNKYTCPKIININKQDLFLLNIINLIFVLLVLSFTNLNFKNLFLIIFLINFILFIFNFKNVMSEIKNNKNLIFNISFFLACIFIFVHQAQNLNLGYDGLQIWKIKVNNFYNGYNYFEVASLYDHVRQYPHLGSFLWAYFWEISLGNKEYFGRLFHIYLYILSLFLIVSSIKNLSEIKKVILFLSFLFFSYDTDLNGY